MFRQLTQAAGYLSILALPALLILGTATGFYWLAAVSLFGVSPLLRLLIGDAAPAAVEWRESLSKFLHFLPVIYAVLFLASIGYVAWTLHQLGELLGHQWLALGASLWATFLTATPPAHELLHRVEKTSQKLGRLVLGVAGYPILGHEHPGHHQSKITRGEWAYADENVYTYTVRQMRDIIRRTQERDQLLRSRVGDSFLRGELAEALLITFTTGVMFTIASGFPGLLLYVALIGLMLFGIQLMTYIQHWGLGGQIEDGNERVYGWEDGCRLQGWLTLNLSFHDAHHRNSTIPFYRLTLFEGSPRLPAGYVVLMIAALVPPLWRRLMEPALHHWMTNPHRPIAPNRRLICINYKALQDLGADISAPGSLQNPATPTPLVSRD